LSKIIHNALFVIRVVFEWAGAWRLDRAPIQVPVGSVFVRSVSGVAAKRRPMDVTQGQTRGPVKTAAIGPRVEKGAAYKHKRQSHPQNQCFAHIYLLKYRMFVIVNPASNLIHYK
jgi:hypothetical protein